METNPILAGQRKIILKNEKIQESPFPVPFETLAKC